MIIKMKAQIKRGDNSLTELVTLDVPQSSLGWNCSRKNNPCKGCPGTIDGRCCYNSSGTNGETVLMKYHRQVWDKYVVNESDILMVIKNNEKLPVLVER